MEYLFINKYNDIWEIFKGFCSVINIQDSEYALNNAVVLSLSLSLFYNFQGLTHSFIYVNMFSNRRETRSYLIVSRKL